MFKRMIFILFIPLGTYLFPTTLHAQERHSTNRTKAFIEKLRPASSLTRAPREHPTRYDEQPGIDKCAQIKSRGIEEIKTSEAVTRLMLDEEEVVLFAFDSAALTDQAQAILDDLGEALSAKELGPYCLRIEGHTDEVGPAAYNRSLSEKRAAAVAHYLSRSFPIAEDRLLRAGYGESQPVATNTSEAGRQKNRRVQISNLGSGQPDIP